MQIPTGFSWVNIRGSADENTPNPAGGIVHLFTAGATLLVGDAVFLSAANTVNKSTTAASYVSFVGFVVGGDSNGDRVDDAVGVTAATVGQAVMVQISGIARAIAGAGITAGTSTNVVPSAAVAGRVIAGTTADQRLGIPTNTQATTAGEVRVLITQF